MLVHSRETNDGFINPLVRRPGGGVTGRKFGEGEEQHRVKQKRKRYNGWPLVMRPDGGSHEWLMRACEREEHLRRLEHIINDENKPNIYFSIYCFISFLH